VVQVTRVARTLRPAPVMTAEHPAVASRTGASPCTRNISETVARDVARSRSTENHWLTLPHISTHTHATNQPIRDFTSGRSKGLPTCMTKTGTQVACKCPKLFKTVQTVCSPGDLRTSSIDRSETYATWSEVGYVLFYSISLKILGAEGASAKKLGRKTCKIRRDFGPSDFDREYLRNGWRYRQAENGVINDNSSQEKLRELWSINQKVKAANVYQHCVCRLMQLRSGHVALLGAEFQPLKLSPQSNVRHRAASNF